MRLRGSQLLNYLKRRELTGFLEIFNITGLGEFRYSSVPLDSSCAD